MPLFLCPCVRYNERMDDDNKDKIIQAIRGLKRQMEEFRRLGFNNDEILETARMFVREHSESIMKLRDEVMKEGKGDDETYE